MICLNEYDQPGQLEAYYRREIEPTLTQAGHKVYCTTQAEVFDHLSSLQPDYLILFALMRQSTVWEIARRFQKARGKEYPYVTILMFIEFAPDDSPDNPAYYALPEYQELYDSYYPGWGFDEWIEGCESGLYGASRDKFKELNEG